jgi:hypothetical protein
MATSHLGHNWFLFELTDEMSQWILTCLSEYIDFVQPYDSMYIRAKKTLSGKKEFKVVFSATYAEHYNFPVCYLLDLNSGKFKGNKMRYCIDSEGTHYADKFPVYSERFKFNEKSKYRRERKALWYFLETLDIPDALPSSKERRYAHKKIKERRIRASTSKSTSKSKSKSKTTNLPEWRIGHQQRKIKKGVFLKNLS